MGFRPALEFSPGLLTGAVPISLWTVVGEYFELIGGFGIFDVIGLHQASDWSEYAVLLRQKKGDGSEVNLSFDPRSYG